MNFPSRDFTNKYISSSYQDALQQYSTGSLFYVLDGLGNVVAVLNSSSIGDLIITSNMTSSMSVASASYAVSYSYSNITIVSSSFASASISSSYSLTASYALNGGSGGGSGVTPGGSYDVSASFASASISASYALTASYAQLSFDSLFSDTASLSIYSDFAGTSSLSANSISSSYALTASYVDVANFDNLVLPFEFSYKNITTNSDPGKGNFRYNNTVTSSITEIYFDNLTAGGLDITNIVESLKSGSYQLYIQQKTDATKVSLFDVRSAVINNAGWLTIPVSHRSSGDGALPNNNAVCAVFVINKNSIIPGETYPVTSSWAISASYAPGSPSISASYAVTASYSLNQGINIPSYDYSTLTYNGPLGQVSDCTYRVGGSGGSIVCIITAIYSGAVFLGISKSLG